MVPCMELHGSLMTLHATKSFKVFEIWKRFGTFWSLLGNFWRKFQTHLDQDFSLETSVERNMLWNGRKYFLHGRKIV